MREDIILIIITLEEEDIKPDEKSTDHTTHIG